MLNFPNESRVFDSTRRAVRFWGHDSAMEWSFFVSEKALKRLQPTMEANEASLLLAFDANRAAIQAAATRAYKQGEKDPMNSRRRIFEVASSTPIAFKAAGIACTPRPVGRPANRKTTNFDD